MIKIRNCDTWGHQTFSPVTLTLQSNVCSRITISKSVVVMKRRYQAKFCKDLLTKMRVRCSVRQLHL